jgi:uncharacterized membrane protein YfcA
VTEDHLLTWAVGVAAVAVAAFVKGAIGFGFPTIATPILALVTDVRTAVVVLLVPNMVMDGIQIARRPGALAAARRQAPVILSGVLGLVVGTHFLVRISQRGLQVILGLVILAAVGLGLARPEWRLPAHFERPVGPAVGLFAGVLGGVTNVFGAPIALYYAAIGLGKVEFVRAVAITFLTWKASQFGAVWQVGLMEARLFEVSLGATGVGLAAFALGLRVQDRVHPQTFNRAVLSFLGVISLAMLARALWR